MGPGAFAGLTIRLSQAAYARLMRRKRRRSRALLAQTLAAASEQLGIPPERTVVAGFSQGAPWRWACC